MSKVLLAVSDRWVLDGRIDAIADFVVRVGSSVLAVHVAYGAEPSGGVSAGEKVLEKIGEQLRGKNLKVETLLLYSDDLGEAILKTAEERKATLILLGLSAKGMLTRLIEGNVAQEIIKGTTLPVLLLPPEWVGGI